MKKKNSRTSPLESRVYRDKKSTLHLVSAPSVSVVVFGCASVGELLAHSIAREKSPGQWPGNLLNFRIFVMFTIFENFDFSKKTNMMP